MPAAVTNSLTLRGHTAHLLPQRALFLPTTKTLLIADLHLGKTQTFHAAGSPIPRGILDADLARLDAALHATHPARLLILGDLLHHPVGITDSLISHISAWRAAHEALDITLIPGNHDRRADLIADAWRITLAPPILLEPPFAFTHDPAHIDDHFTFAGHIHPQVRLASRTDSLRLPCFWIQSTIAILPAFSHFTRGLTITPEPADRVFAIAEDHITEVSDMCHK